MYKQHIINNTLICYHSMHSDKTTQRQCVLAWWTSKDDPYTRINFVMHSLRSILCYKITFNTVYSSSCFAHRFHVVYSFLFLNCYFIEFTDHSINISECKYIVMKLESQHSSGRKLAQWSSNRYSLGHLSAFRCPKM